MPRVVAENDDDEDRSGLKITWCGLLNMCRKLTNMVFIAEELCCMTLDYEGDEASRRFVRLPPEHFDDIQFEVAEYWKKYAYVRGKQHYGTRQVPTPANVHYYVRRLITDTRHKATLAFEKAARQQHQNYPLELQGTPRAKLQGTPRLQDTPEPAPLAMGARASDDDDDEQVVAPAANRKKRKLTAAARRRVDVSDDDDDDAAAGRKNAQKTPTHRCRRRQRRRR